MFHKGVGKNFIIIKERCGAQFYFNKDWCEGEREEEGGEENIHLKTHPP